MVVGQQHQPTTKKKESESYTIVGENGANVAQQEDPTSAKVTVLVQGTHVQVEEMRGRRMRISQPTTGWISRVTASGEEIAQKGNAVKKNFFFFAIFFFSPWPTLLKLYIY